MIIVDDRSTDGTSAIAIRNGARVVKCPAPGGPGVARNTGAAASSGDPILFLDADTLPPDTWIEECLALLKTEGPRTAAFWGGYDAPTVDTPLARLQLHDIQWHQEPLPDYVQVLTSANMGVRRAAFIASGGFPDLVVDEDYVFGARVSKHGRIRWASRIRVKHLFRTRWRDYLRQQFRWAEYIPLMYAEAPELLGAEQSFRRNTIAVELTGLILVGIGAAFSTAALLQFPFILPELPSIGVKLALACAAIGMSLWVATAFQFSRWLKARGNHDLPVLRYMLLRDAVWLAGLAWGSVRHLPSILNRLRGSRPSPAQTAQS